MVTLTVRHQCYLNWMSINRTFYFVAFPVPNICFEPGQLTHVHKLPLTSNPILPVKVLLIMASLYQTKDEVLLSSLLIGAGKEALLLTQSEGWRKSCSWLLFSGRPGVRESQTKIKTHTRWVHILVRHKL